MKTAEPPYRRLVVPACLLAAALALLAGLPFYGSDYLSVMMSNVLMYVILSVSWAIFSGPTGYVSLAPAAFFGIGVYTSAVLGNALPLPALLVIGALAAFVSALLVGFVTLRLRGVYFTIFTFGLVELLKEVVLWWEVNVTGQTGRIVVGADYSTVYYVTLGIFVLLMAVAWFIRSSRYGLALQSIGEYEEASAHTGVNVIAMKTTTFAVSAMFMGAVGVIMATRWTYIDPTIAFNPLFSFMPVLMAIFGGVGRLYGPVVGAAVFAYLEELLTTQFPYHYMLIFGIILVLAILYLPRGLVGWIEALRDRLWRRQHAHS